MGGLGGIRGQMGSVGAIGGVGSVHRGIKGADRDFRRLLEPGRVWQDQRSLWGPWWGRTRGYF